MKRFLLIIVMCIIVPFGFVGQTTPNKKIKPEKKEYTYVLTEYWALKMENKTLNEFLTKVKSRFSKLKFVSYKVNVKIRFEYFAYENSGSSPLINAEAYNYIKTPHVNGLRIRISEIVVDNTAIDSANRIKPPETIIIQSPNTCDKM